jgi:hypothetical protein
MVPKFSSSQTKMIRTFEGILVLIFSIGLVVASTITQTLSPASAAKWGGIVAAATVVGRQIGKGIGAVQEPYMGDVTVVPVPPDVEMTSTPDDAVLVAKPGSALPADEHPPAGEAV